MTDYVEVQIVECCTTCTHVKGVRLPQPFCQLYGTVVRRAILCDRYEDNRQVVTEFLRVEYVPE